LHRKINLQTCADLWPKKFADEERKIKKNLKEKEKQNEKII
jgi:hypothetical protein